MERQKAGFDFAVLEIIEDLIDGRGGTVFDREQFFHIFDIEVGNAPAPNFSGHSKLLECFHGFRERHAGTPRLAGPSGNTTVFIKLINQETKKAGNKK